MAKKYHMRPEVIDKARERLGFTSDEQLAVHLGVSSGTITRVRKGETPSFATAILLLDAAGVTLAGIVKNDRLAA